MRLTHMHDCAGYVIFAGMTLSPDILGLRLLILFSWTSGPTWALFAFDWFCSYEKRVAGMSLLCGSSQWVKFCVYTVPIHHPLIAADNTNLRCQLSVATC